MAWLKVLKKLGRHSTKSLPELLGIRAVEKENPMKENPEEFISVFSKAARWYMVGEASILLSASSEAAWLQVWGDPRVLLIQQDVFSTPEDPDRCLTPSTEYRRRAGFTAHGHEHLQLSLWCLQMPSCTLKPSKSHPARMCRPSYSTGRSSSWVLFGFQLFSFLLPFSPDHIGFR